MFIYHQQRHSMKTHHCLYVPAQLIQNKPENLAILKSSIDMPRPRVPISPGWSNQHTVNTLELWNFGTLKFWNFETLKLWNHLIYFTES